MTPSSPRWAEGSTSTAPAARASSAWSRSLFSRRPRSDHRPLRGSLGPLQFVDEASFVVRAGRGGDGSVSFNREKYKPRGARVQGEGPAWGGARGPSGAQGPLGRGARRPPQRREILAALSAQRRP